MKLIVAIPERWEDESCAVAWALVRPDGTLEREGKGLIADLPSVKRTTLVVAASRVLLATATLPSRGARRIRGALAYAVEDQLTSDPESVHAVAAGALRGNRQSVAVIEREWLRNLIASFESAVILPDSVTVETCLAPIADGEWTLVLRDDGGFLRTGEATGMGLESAFDGTVPGALQLVLDAARNAGAAPRRIVVRADSAPDLEAWSHKLGVPCEAAGPWHRWQCAGRPSIEFLQGEFARTSRGLSQLWPRLRLAAIFAMAALAIEVVGTFCHWGALRYEKAQLLARMNDQFRAAFPQAQAIVDPALQMRRNLQVARAAAGIAQAGDFLPLLAEAARGATDNPAWRLKSISYNPGKLTVNVALTDGRQADSVLQRLAQGPIHARLEALDSNSATVGARFVLVPRETQ